MGIDGILGAGQRALALARTGAGYDELAGELGFDRLATDDSGFTYLWRR